MQAKPLPDRRSHILVLIFCGIGILGLLIRGIYLIISGILSFDPGDIANLSAPLLGALAMLFCAALLVPAMYYSIKRLTGKDIPQADIRPIKVWQVLVLISVWVFVVVLGAVLVGLLDYGWLIAAPLFLLGISLPIFTLVWIGAGGLPAGSRLRPWFVLGFGMLGGTLVSVLLEYLLLGIAVAIVGLLAATNPELRTILDQVQNQVLNAKGGDIQSLLTVLAPYLMNPLIILSILLFAAVVGPMIEESLKPAVIWFLGKHLRTPAEGFVLGILCGAGFAMLEGLIAASGAAQMWGFALAGRAAASLMHITASGLLGWAIASVQLQKRYGRLIVVYILSVSIHGLWNGSAIIAVYGALRTMVQGTQTDFLSMFFMLAGFMVLVLEFILMLAVLPLINNYLRRKSSPRVEEAQSDIISPALKS
jgi:RsiW-degrading membrane proteinase PrsW (M82 family)